MRRARQGLAAFVTALLGAAGMPAPAGAEVTSFRVLSVQSPALEGRVFGRVGTYEKLTGQFTVVLDPADLRNAGIADIALAPRNAQGKVEATADVVILRPTRRSRAGETLLYEVVNRGRKLGLGLFNDAGAEASRLETAAHAGNGFLMQQGYTLVWSGWQADLAAAPGVLTLDAPTLTGLTGPGREEFVFDDLQNPKIVTLAWPAANPSGFSVKVRARHEDRGETPSDLRLRVIDPLRVEISRPAGFDAGAVYEIAYTARDPKVLGVGFAATRDLVSFLRHDARSINPLADRGRPTVRRAYAYGSSQSGRFLREFLYLGFNEDLAGRSVFDAMLPHIAGARMTALNLRFGLPSRNARHPKDPAWAADRFPFSYAEAVDPFSGTRDGLMVRCRRTGTCPKVIQADSEHEWWAARASLLITDGRGGPLGLPRDVRLFMTVGAPHDSPADATVRASRMCRMPLNPIAQGPVLRALLSDLDAWAARGVDPPPSRVPTLGTGGLVKAETVQPPRPIPGLPYSGLHTRAFAVEANPRAPILKGEYPVYVPRLDADGMVAEGVRLPVVAAAKSTYTGWNPRAEGYGPSALCPLQGGVVPFARTRRERAADDPRPSVEERYASAAAYVAAVRTAAKALVRDRLMRREDASEQVRAAREDRLAR